MNDKVNFELASIPGYSDFIICGNEGCFRHATYACKDQNNRNCAIIFLLGVSDTKADKDEHGKYVIPEKENISWLAGLRINNSKHAETLSQYFKNMADKMKEEEANGK